MTSNLITPSQTKTVEYQTVDLTPYGFDWCDMGLRVIGAPTFQQWEQVGILLRLEHAQLSRLATKVQFAIGDWLNYGERAYGEKYAQALTETDYAQGTLQNFAYVARKVTPSLRRETLTYKHHAVVAPLDPPAQSAWLEKAESGEWSANALSEKVQAEQGNPPPHAITCPECGAMFSV